MYFRAFLCEILPICNFARSNYKSDNDYINVSSHMLKRAFVE